MDVGTLTGSGAIQAIGGNGTRDRLKTVVRRWWPGGDLLRHDDVSCGNILMRVGRLGTQEPRDNLLRDNALSHGVLLVNNGSIVSSTNTPLRTQLGTFRTWRYRSGRLVLVIRMLRRSR